MSVPTIDQIDFFGKKVILRVDWNIPTKDGVITDDSRIVASLPTIRKILSEGVDRVVIIAHFGRPKGKNDKDSWKRFLAILQTYFQEALYFLEDGLSVKTLDILDKTNNRLYLLENIRFHDVETNYLSYPEDNMEREIMQQLGDVFVNDAFGCMHRDHLSICGIPKKVRAIGYLVEKELNALKLLLENPEGKRILGIIGGGKMDDKLPLVQKLSTKMDTIYLCGGNINSILKASSGEESVKKGMSEFIETISKNRAKIHYMVDGLCAENLTAMPEYATSRTLPTNKNFLDAGIKSLFELDQLIEQSDIIFWNGTLGVVESNLYHHGSTALVDRLIRASSQGKKVIVGGGDTGGFVNRFPHNFYYITTGGGATLEYLSNGSLLGVEFIQKI